jgi:hypothetical protein
VRTRQDGRGQAEGQPHVRNTPEGAGVRYISANLKFLQAIDTKTPPADKARLLGNVKTLCQELERFENDYRIVAFRLKIKTIAAEGGFARKITELRTFDDCYVRARYEADVMEEELKKYRDDPAKLPGIRKAGFANIIDALQRAIDFANRAGPTQRIPVEDVNERGDARPRT